MLCVEVQQCCIASNREQMLDKHIKIMHNSVAGNAYGVDKRIFIYNL